MIKENYCQKWVFSPFFVFFVCREQRIGIDLTHDKVDCELRKEREVLEGGISMLERMMEQVKEESRELRAQRYLLDRDLNALEEAIKIDEYNRQLRRTALNLSLYEGDRSLDNRLEV